MDKQMGSAAERRSPAAGVIVPARTRDRAATTLIGIDVEVETMDPLDPASIGAFVEMLLVFGQPLTRTGTSCTPARCAVTRTVWTKAVSQPAEGVALQCREKSGPIGCFLR
jgi:hypothetical protein